MVRKIGKKGPWWGEGCHPSTLPCARSKFWGVVRVGGQGWGVTTISNSLILGEWVTKVFKNGDKKWGGGGVEGWVPTIF